MYIYGDESGHTGKSIFDKPPFYLQGAILSVVDTEPLLRPICDRYKKNLNVERLHANELRQHVVEEISLVLLEALSDVRWVFHITAVEKRYLAVTKFVDSIFDSAENKGVRWLWYNHEFFRHTLCCLFDELLPMTMKQTFWEAYLKDDYARISAVIQFALDQLHDDIHIDARLPSVSEWVRQFLANN